MYKEPKFKIGDTVEATWASGKISIHIIIGIEENHHGYWYTWKRSDVYSWAGSGLHEKYLRKIKEIQR